MGDFISEKSSCVSPETPNVPALDIVTFLDLQRQTRE